MHQLLVHSNYILTFFENPFNLKQLSPNLRDRFKRDWIIRYTKAHALVSLQFMGHVYRVA